MALGIDIGGANTKAASDSAGFTFSRYAPFWETADIDGLLKEICRQAGAAGEVGVVVTAELADCFESKSHGLIRIESAVKKVMPDALFFGYDGRFHEEMADYRNFAGANWMASALLLARKFPDAILLDVGSTTTDIIPIVDGEVRGLPSDIKRLGASQLVYSGVQRTNVATKLQRVRLGGRDFRVASELFATALDAYVTLGELRPEGHFSTPADGKDAGPESCARRLARVLCSEPEELGNKGVRAIAEQMKEAQVRELRDALVEVSRAHGVRHCLLAGSGEFLARHVVDGLGWPITSLSLEYGKMVSEVFPAYAAACLLEGER